MAKLQFITDLEYTEALDAWDSLPDRPAFGRFPNLHPSSLLSDYRREFQSGLMLPKSFQRSSPFRLDFSTMLLSSLYPGGGLMSSASPQMVYGGGGYGYVPTTVTFRDPNASPLLPPAPLPVERRDMPVVGFRAWTYAKGEFKLGVGITSVTLQSTGITYTWGKGDLTATCTNVTHAVPDEGCGCGFYVLRDVDQVETHAHMNDGLIVGAVVGWGRVVQHGDEGWRAEKARLLALMDCKYSQKQLRRTRKAAESYGVEVKSRQALEALVTEYGDPLPKEVPA